MIGYGNPLREDDGVGWAAVELLEQAPPDERVRAHACHQLTPELAEPVSAAGTVLFIDARAGGVAGQVEIREVEPDAGTPPGLTHALSPGALLALARELYGACSSSSTAAQPTPSSSRSGLP